MEQSRQKHDGRSTPLTVITPILPGFSFISGAFLWIMSKVSTLVIARQLEFIHFARWQRIRVKDFPRLSQAQPKEELDRDYEFFSTNFNGRWDQYIDTFAIVEDVRKGIWWLWRFCHGFPGPLPIRHFKTYIDYHTYPLSFYYNAYPEATVRDINASLIVSRALDKFRDASSDNESDEAFWQRQQEFLEEVADHLTSSTIFTHGACQNLEEQR